ncbi:MAG: Lar family restriction alleviation protein [Synergistaceae bacterium]|nr:Lar family restriction alleviation protein [Synergistaceae bacterium]
MTEKLKPCPFCGNQDIHYYCYSDNNEENFYTVECHECGICIGINDKKYKTKSEAIKAWNTRANQNMELKACPCCGDNPKKITYKSHFSFIGNYLENPVLKTFIICPTCGLSTSEWNKETEEEAIKQWNRRINI